MSSPANAKYALAPYESGIYFIPESPWLGASANFTFLGIRVLKIKDAKCVSNSFET